MTQRERVPSAVAFSRIRSTWPLIARAPNMRWRRAFAPGEIPAVALHRIS